MRDAVRHLWVPFNAPIEGVVTFMYLDVKGLVTTGMGNLIDTPDEALSLAWLRSDGTLATRREVAAEWSFVKSLATQMHPTLGAPWPKVGGGRFASVTRLRLSDAGVDALVDRTLARMTGQMAARFPDFEDWPTDAQLGVMSMCWAGGAGVFAKFPKFCRHINALDFAAAAKECRLAEAGNPGVVAIEGEFFAGHPVVLS